MQNGNKKNWKMCTSVEHAFPFFVIYYSKKCSSGNNFPLLMSVTSAPNKTSDPTYIQVSIRETTFVRTYQL